MNDNEMIKDCIQLYFDGCYESDPEKIKASFNPNASITGYLPDGFHEMSVDDFAGFVASQQPSPMENNDEKMLEIPVYYTHLRAHETREDMVLRLRG